MTLDLKIVDNLSLKEQSTLIFVDNHYEIKGFDDFLKAVDRTVDFINSHEYTDEDRKSLSSARKAVNEYTKRVAELIDGEMNKTFGAAMEQKSQIQAKLNSITATLKTKIDESDRLARLKKQQMFQDEILREAEYIDLLKNVDVFDVIDASWLNRSASDKKNLKELHSRLDAIVKLTHSKLCQSTDVLEICGALQLFDWSELDAIEFIASKYQKMAEVINDVENSSQELTESEHIVEVVEEKEILQIEIKSSDFANIISILKNSGIEFKIM